ncbi:MAG: HAD family hydrolase [Methanomassiliicoccaceae archaeon]|nr:HAD family hydrolase [Methanomassiliicoccaceae archaeon]
MLRSRKYLAVGFDMDSTLLRTDVDYSELTKVVFTEMAKAGVPESIMSVAEGTSRSNLDAGIKYLERNGRAGDVDRIVKKINGGVKAIEMRNVMTATPYEGAEMMLMHLKGKGYKVGVLTRGSREYAVKALTVSGVIDILDALVCKDDFPENESKPSPAAMRHLADALGVTAADILYLGDNKFDYFCARDSGAGFAGVLTRYTKKDWETFGNVDVINTVTDLMKIL